MADSDDKRRALQQFLGELPSPPPPLEEALYALSELGLWPDAVDSVSARQAMMCWALVERVMRSGFPKELRL
jgi:hypothetical protein